MQDRPALCWIHLIIFCMLAAVLLPGSTREAAAQDGPSSEYRVKAVFLYHFTQFVEWPPGAFSGANAPIVIGVLGDDPFGAALDETVATEVINGHPLTVWRVERPEEIDRCHILFVSRSEEHRLEPILRSTSERPLLTVSDIEDFAVRGGLIEFVTERSKIGLRINNEAARRAGLTISSKLLRLADVTTSREG